jgi:hypothetical protein
MAIRLPTPGSDNGRWGDILNEYLSVEHATDGSLKNVARPGDSVVASQLSAIAAPSGKQILSYNGTDLRWRNRDWVNAVEDYGFVGNGTTDNTAAMAAMLADNPPVIFLPAGVYIMDSFSLATNRQRWMGASPGSFNEGATGRRSVIKLKNGGTTHLMTRPAGVLNVEFRDICFDGNGSNQTNTSNVIEIASPGSGEDTGLRFTRCYFTGARNRNVHLGSLARNTTFLDCVNYGAGNEGYLIESSDNRIINGAIAAAGGDGVAIKDWTNQVLGPAIFSNGGAGVNVFSTATMTQVADCQIDRNQLHGVYTAGEGTTINGCVFHLNSQSGSGATPTIQIAAANNIISSCIFGVDASGSGTKPSYDIFVNASLTASIGGNARRTGASLSGSFAGTVLQAGQLASQFATVASTAAMPTPSATTISVTGTTGITSLGSGVVNGQRVCLVFQASLTVTDGSNLRLGGNFSAVAGSVLELIWDGTFWNKVR